MKTEKGYFDQRKASANFSLLSPKSQSSAVSWNGGDEFLALNPAAAHDLQLDDLIAAFTPDRAHQKEIHDLFSQLPRDPQVISYRQAVLDDLLANPELVERFTRLLPVIDSLFEFPFRPRPEMSWLHEVVWRA